MSWSDGYVADTAYTHHYYAELAPPHLDLMALTAGVQPPEGAGGSFRYCELGCGNGMSTNLLAAANPAATFVGIDFMPVHVATANQVARRAGISNVQFLEMSFAEACKQSFEPFDYIVAHGVYSWITPANRAEMVEFFRRFLAPGGLVYLSYNTYPGWLTIAPVQKVVSEYADSLRGASTQRVKAGFEFATKLLQQGAAALAQSPAAKAQIERASSMPRNYLAQEYLNAAWYPMYVTEVMRELQPAKLEYVASATAAENDLRFLVSDELAATIREQPTEELRQLIKDISINARFRRDIYARGARRLTGLDQRQMLGACHVALVKAPEAIAYSADYLGRKISFDTPLAREVVKALGERPHSFAELAERVRFTGHSDPMRATVEVCLVLMVSGALVAVAPTGAEVDAVNASLARHAMEDTATNAVATRWGTGAQVTSLELAMLAVGAPGDDKVALAEKLVQMAQAKGRAFAKGGVSLTDPGETKAFLQGEAEAFLAARLRVLERLGIRMLGQG